ncbi:MAG: hypothetical protein K9N35_00540 [Candidatus Marinimicrobia bacterium]|nr:hypothetical protein [Candidatus Neomarinimicrobiota bacterium]
MGYLDLSAVYLVSYLFVAGYLMILFGKRVSASRQHEFAFAGIILLIIGIFPQLNISGIAPGILLSLGMILIALHFSAYYSGTAKNSARMYAVLLWISAIMLAVLVHPLIKESSFVRMLIGGSAAVGLFEIEKIIASRSYTASRAEKTILGVWILTSCIGLINEKIDILPDLLFLLLLIIHLEKRWFNHDLPAPIVALYGTLVMWFSHFMMLDRYSLDATASFQNPAFSFSVILMLVILLLQSFRSASLTKKYLYYFLVQETLVMGSGMGNIFSSSSELFGLQRYLLFVALMGMFVMIESREGESINAQGLQGIFHERARFTVVFLSLAFMFVLYFTVHLWGMDNFLEVSLLGALVVVGLIWVLRLMQTAIAKTNRKHRILRPSLSIWSTVVFTLLWAAVTLLEIILKIIDVSII